MFRAIFLVLALAVASCDAAEPEKLRSIAEGLTKAKGDFVFASLPPQPSSSSSSPSPFESVEVSARTTKGLRLEGTAMRSLGVSLRGWRIGPCVGVGPFTTSTAAIFQSFPPPSEKSKNADEGPALVWNQIASTNSVGGGKDANVTTKPVKPGEAVAIWPSLTQVVRNDGCGAAEGVLFLRNDGDDVSFGLHDFLAEFPGESFEAGAGGKLKDALNGGDGRYWVDKACERRCGVSPKKDASAKKP